VQDLVSEGTEAVKAGFIMTQHTTVYLYIQFLKPPALFHRLALQLMCRSIGHVTTACLCSGHRQWCHLTYGVSTDEAVFDCSFTSTYLVTDPHGFMMTAGKTQEIQTVQYKQLIAHANLQALIAHTQLLIEHAQRCTTSILCLTSGWWLCSIACDATLNWRSWM
jgi:hypothetical protein